MHQLIHAYGGDFPKEGRVRKFFLHNLRRGGIMNLHVTERAGAKTRLFAVLTKLTKGEPAHDDEPRNPGYRDP